MTKPNKKDEYFTSDTVLEDFYCNLASYNGTKLRKVHIPRSDVFYCRCAYEAATGHKISLDRMERAMYLEGMLSRNDVYKPDEKRDWE